jgi:eukaryotic-like serine/threonine-protein kinase
VLRYGFMACSLSGTQMLKNDIHARWIESAIEMRMLAATEAAQVLLSAARSDDSIAQVVERQFSTEPARLSSLLLLLDSLDAQGAANSGELPSHNACGSSAGSEECTLPSGKSRNFKPSITRTWREEQATKPTHSSPLEDQPSSKNRDHVGPDTPRSSSLVGGFKTGLPRYEPTTEVGRGGCGVVTKARDLQLDRDVVIKRIIDSRAVSDEIVQRFLNEARITGQLEHPGIVPVYELGTDEAGLPFYAMKEVRGVTLAAKIAELHAMPDNGVKRLLARQLLHRFLDVCQTLAFAHQACVVHRDLKPANVMVGEFGETLLLDWGIARRTQKNSRSAIDEGTLVAGQPNDTLDGASSTEKNTDGVSASEGDAWTTRQGTIMGTASYMAPEQARGWNDRVNEQSDVFSLGVILYEILSGQSPFRTDSVETTIQRVANCDYPPLRESAKSVPRALAAICGHAMQHEPTARYTTAQQMAADLESFLAGGRVSVYREPFWERFDRIANNHRGLFRTGFAALLVVAVTALVAVAQIARARHAEKAALGLAIHAKSFAEQAYANEKTARQRTQLQLESSREAADRWLIDLSGDLQFYPGMESIRSALIEQGQKHYTSVLEAATNELSSMQNQLHVVNAAVDEDQLMLAREIGFCQIRLGDLARLRGETQIALESFAAAQGTLQAAIEQAATHDVLLRQLHIQLANASIGLAMIQPETSGASEESSQTLAETRQTLQQILAADPSSIEARNALTRARVVAARIARRQGAQSDAISLLADALPDADILLQQIPGQRSSKLKANILEERANLLFEIGNYSAATLACGDLIAMYDQQLRLQPHRPDLFEARSIAKSLLGSCKLGESSVQPAIVAYHAAERDLDEAWELLYGEEFYRENHAVLAANQGITACDPTQLGHRQRRRFLATLIANNK